MIDSMDRVPTGAECAATMMLSKRAPESTVERNQTIHGHPCYNTLQYITIYCSILQCTKIYYNVQCVQCAAFAAFMAWRMVGPKSHLEARKILLWLSMSRESPGKQEGYLLGEGSLTIRNILFWRSILGAPILGNYQV